MVKRDLDFHIRNSMMVSISAAMQRSWVQCPARALDMECIGTSPESHTGAKQDNTGAESDGTGAQPGGSGAELDGTDATSDGNGAGTISPSKDSRCFVALILQLHKKNRK